jgi:hypothetical protein
MRNIMLRNVTIFCLVDIDHRLRINGLLVLLDIRKGKLYFKVPDGGLLWNISKLLHQQWLVTTRTKRASGTMESLI